MDKLSMCRICLVENVRMHVVADKDLQEIYERLTDFPFQTEDGRPLLACSFCFTKLKQCCQLLRKCLDAEKLFDQMVYSNYEPNTPLTYPGQLEYFGGLTITPIEHVSVADELTRIPDDDEVAADDDDWSDDCVSAYKLEINKIEVEHQNVGDQDCTEQQEHLSLGVPVATKSTLDVRRANLEDSITAQQKKNQLTGTKKQNFTPKPTTISKKPTDTNNLKKNIGKLYVCDICQRNFRLKSTLYNHIQKHFNTQKPFKCKECQKCFRHDSHLKYHIYSHTGEKPYKCDVCRRRFRNKYNYENHILLHSDKKQHKCEVCQSRFSSKYGLKRHMEIHTVGKPYTCDVCQRSFNRKANLVTHIWTHSGKKPYQCEICSKCFGQSSTLNGHLRVHRKEK